MGKIVGLTKELIAARKGRVKKREIIFYTLF